MAFIKKQKLVEKIEEAPVVETITESVDENALHDALLEVFSEETKRISKLKKAIELAEKAGKDDLVRVLKTSGSITKRNIAETYKRSNKILNLAEEQEVDEAIDDTKVYSGEKIYDIVTDHQVDFMDDGNEATYDALERAARWFDDDTDYTAEEIDSLFDRVNLDPQVREPIETEISQLPDARKARIEEFKSDIDNDISEIEYAIEHSYTYPAKNRLREVISELKEIPYDGSPNVCWNVMSNNQNKHPTYID